MAPGMDHVVIAVGDLDRAARVYERLGFTVTPRAEHPWGTANRLVQFSGENYIELLALERPELVPDHDPAALPPRFSFGAYNRDFARLGEGMSMLALHGSPHDGDMVRNAGFTGYAPFDFRRQAVLPDGRKVELAFSLTYAVDLRLARACIFFCYHHHPENFWRPAYQSHKNGARRVAEVILVAADPAALDDYFTILTGQAPALTTAGLTAAFGSDRLLVMTPDAYRSRYGLNPPDLSHGPRFAGFAVTGPDLDGRITPPGEASGAMIEWRPGG
jgi:hypothetical protein